MNPTSIYEDESLIPSLAQWVKDLIALSCGVGRRLGSDSALLWLWHRPAAVAPIQPLAWEPPYAASAPLKLLILPSTQTLTTTLYFFFSTLLKDFLKCSL